MQTQIAAAHLELIELSLAAPHDPHARTQLAAHLDIMHSDGWQALSHALQQRFGLPSQHDSTMQLDDEDHAIIALIEHAQSHPEDFAVLAAQAAANNQQHVAQALAAVVYAATQGEREALEALAELHQAADTPAALAASAALIRMIEGERDAETLSHELPAEQSALIHAVLKALHSLEI